LANVKSMETFHCPDDGLLEIGFGLPVVVPGNVKMSNVIAGNVDEVDELVHVHRGDLVFDLAVFHIVCCLLLETRTCTTVSHPVTSILELFSQFVEADSESGPQENEGKQNDLYNGLGGSGEFSKCFHCLLFLFFVTIQIYKNFLNYLLKCKNFLLKI